jgi:PIN domain nuclease of toxin-antitoxin system
MKIPKRKVYWDTTCWLAWLHDERLWPANILTGLQDVVHEVETGTAVLFTSAITRGEIFWGKLDLDQKNMFAKLMRRTNVTEVSADPRITDRVSQIREYHAARGQRVQTPDATHLATAVLYRADEFHTMDGLGSSGSKRGLLKLNGDVGGYRLMIVHPYPRHTPPAQAVSIKGPLFPEDV